MPRRTVLSVARDPVEVSRRFFLQLGAAGVAAQRGGPLWAAAEESYDVLAYNA